MNPKLNWLLAVAVISGAAGLTAWEIYASKLARLVAGAFFGLMMILVCFFGLVWAIGYLVYHPLPWRKK